MRAGDGMAGAAGLRLALEGRLSDVPPAAMRRLLSRAPDDEEQIRELLARREVPLTSLQERNLSGTGYALVRFRGIVLTVGLYRARQEGGVLIGAVPKSWLSVAL